MSGDGKGAMAPGRIDWGPVKADVETSEDSLVAIARRHGLKHGTLTQQVCRKGWLRPWQAAGKAEAKRMALAPDAAFDEWTALIQASMSRMLSCQQAIEMQMIESGDVAALKAAHTQGMTALERTVKVVGQFAKILKERSDKAIEDDDWASVTQLERELFARAGLTEDDPPGGQEPAGG
jgi:hypothetical protein